VADNTVKLLTGVASTQREGSLLAMGTAMSRGSGLLNESLERVAAYLALFGGAGIVAVPGLRPRGIDRAQIRGNRVTGLVGDGIALRTWIVSAQIDGNVVQQVGGDGITMSEQATAEELAIEDNQLFEIGGRRRGERDARTIIGAVVLRNVVDALVLGNQIRVVGADAPQALGRVGVLAVGAVNLRVGSNSILDVGADEFAGVGAGVLAGGFFQRVDVHDNTIRRSTRAIDDKGSASFWAAIGIVGAATSALAARFGLEERNADDDQAGALHEFFDRVPGAVVVEDDERVYAVQPAAGKIVASSYSNPGSVGVHGNVADSSGRGGAILVTAGACVVGENRATFISRSEPVAAVVLTAGQVIANANQVVVYRRQIAIKIQAGPCTVLGNVTTGPIILNNATLGPPWDVLNA
jgi:hypothetical protein